MTYRTGAVVEAKFTVSGYCRDEVTSIGIGYRVLDELRFILRPPLRPSVFALSPPAPMVGEFSTSASALPGPLESGCVSSHKTRAATVGSIPDFRHHATSSPQPWTSRWWPRHRGTVNSSLTLRPSARLWL